MAAIKVLDILRKDKTKDALLKYGVAMLWGIAILLPTVVLDLTTGSVFPFFLAYIAVVASSWHGGFRAGLVTVVVTVAATAGYFFYGYQYQSLPLNSPIMLFLFGIAFIVQGALISFAIDRIRKFDELSKYRKRVREQAKLIILQRKEAAAAQEEIKARDEFLSIASHELKTPLTSMILQIQALLYSIRNVSLANFSVQNLLKKLESAEEQSWKLTRMINDLLNVSLITTGRLSLEVEKVELTDLIKDVIERSSGSLEDKNYSVRIDANGPVRGTWDKIRIEQVVVNLLSNAIKYGNGKPIEIKIRKRNSVAKISVKDSGIGIPAEQHKRIFTRFARDVKPADYKGLGVGLYITNQIVNAHKGKIRVKSSPGKGSTFTIELPLEPKKQREKA